MLSSARALSFLSRHARHGKFRVADPWDQLERLITPSTSFNVFDDATFSSWPQVDIVEKPESFNLHMDLPGVADKDVDVRVTEGRVEISGKRTQETSEEIPEKNMRRMERTFGSFKRAFTLPETVDETKIAAHLDKGVLEVTLPKKPQQEPQEARSIPVQKK